MTFFSLAFLFLFFPLSLLVYYLVPARARRGVLLGESVLLLLAAGIMTAVIVLLLTVLTYAAGTKIARLCAVAKRRRAAGLLAVMIVFEFLLLVFLRSDFLADWSERQNISIRFFPFGLSYFVLQSVGFLIDIYTEKGKEPQKFGRIALYFLFFPRLFLGPVLSEHTARPLFADVTFSLETLGRGLSRLIVGISKVLLLAAPLLTLVQTLFSGASATYSLFSFWLGLFGGVCAWYLLFSGLCDMSLGIAHCFGIRLPESFVPKLCFPTVTQTAENTNKTVVQWFMQFVGARFPISNAATRTIAFVATWSLIGLWYDFRLTAWIGGALAGVIIAIEYAVDNNVSSRHRPIRYVATILLLCVCAVFFFSPHLSNGFDALRAMIGFGMLAPRDSDIALWRTAIVVFLVAVYVSTGHWRRMLSRTLYNGRLRFWRTPLTVLALAVLLFCDGCVLFSGVSLTLPLL